MSGSAWTASPLYTWQKEFVGDCLATINALPSDPSVPPPAAEAADASGVPHGR